MSRNNILQVPSRQNYSILHETPPANDGDTSFDYDLYNGVADVKGVDPVEPHGIAGTPLFTGGTASFTLGPNSPGVDKGVPIPNFADAFRGAGPDMGAQEQGQPAIGFGVAASTQERTG
jgi:hypothetical protein